MIRVRRYRPADAPALWRLFHDTIRNVNAADYSPEQVAAWAPDEMDPEYWQHRMDGLQPFVAEIDGDIVGYADCQPNGLVDHFFVHRNRQGLGVGTELMRRVESRAANLGIDRLHAQVSITARPFFERRGFTVDQEQRQKIGDQELKNYRMSRRL